MPEAEVIRFKTRMFDLTKERPNPINPIYGESLLLWLAEKTKGNLSMTPPDAEDWGWYCHVDWHGRSYMLGACVYDEEDGPHEWDPANRETAVGAGTTARQRGDDSG